MRKSQVSTNQEEQTKNHQAVGYWNTATPPTRQMSGTDRRIFDGGGRGPNFVSENTTETFFQQIASPHN